MLIKSIKLSNIRSYENQEIKFPIGSVLLAGDIGSGKSSILLAIEFGLFGPKKGELPAYTLLRHGKRDGSVELRMDIDGKDVIVKRALRRGSEDIKQESGYVVVNGIKKEGTAEELRAVLLELLGYPKELVKKGKDMIYRYTVYTPQEEMKKILYEGKDVRLDTLRKVFDIDKYKRITENSRIIAAYIREKKRHVEGFIMDLGSKKKELEEKKREISEIGKRISDAVPKINGIKAAIAEKRKSVEHIEKDIVELNALRREISLAEASLSHKTEQGSRLSDEINTIEKQIEVLSRQADKKEIREIGDIKNMIMEKEREMGEADKSLKSAIRKIREIEVRIEECAGIVSKLKSIEVCPMCEQKVSEEHRHKINLRENEKREALAAQIKMFREQELKLEKSRLELKKELDALLKEESHIGVLKIRLESINEKSNALKEKTALREKIVAEIGMLNSRKKELGMKIVKYSGSEERYKAVKKEIDGLLPQERLLELEKNRYETERNSLGRSVAGLEKEISEKQKAKEKLSYIMQINNWIGELFTALMSAMERHVMVSVHSQFNGLFRSWFGVIMEDESVSVRIDEEFTPVIEQNGYETYIESLSGGEKTSVALSYRLALNKVVNDVTAGIKTKDIIMLDEPTDGFSSEQLDRVREVLRQLNMRQIIIVSHEGKIEGFVDNVIRVYKQENVSFVDN